MKGTLSTNESLRMLNTWHVGGVADKIYRPHDLHDLALFLQTLPQDEPITWLGLGSNVLIRDGGLRGTVILTQGLLNQIDCDDEGVIRAEAGVTCAKMSKFCAKHARPAGVFFAGIPGTVGGALAMNAGAFGGETWSHVTKVELLDRQGRLSIHPYENFSIGYRQVSRPDDAWFVAGYFHYPKDESIDVKSDIKQLLKKRNDTQPIGQPSCGSVFRNPMNDHAARLIESCGLKGHTLGGAQISPKHANFIVNIGHASAKDIEQLMLHVQETVLEQTGVYLRPEVHILGEKSI